MLSSPSNARKEVISSNLEAARVARVLHVLRSTAHEDEHTRASVLELLAAACDAEATRE